MSHDKYWTDAEAPMVWPLDCLFHLLEKTLILVKTGRDKKEKREAEDKMVTKHYPLNGDESKQTPGGSEEQGSLVCCSPWGHKESDMS